VNLVSNPAITHVAVVLPAMDEAGTLRASLDAIFAAVHELRRTAIRRYAVSVVAVLDSCTDSSLRIASSYPNLTTITVNHANVGESRAEGIRVALADLRSPRSVTWIANTDADSLVPAGWLTAQVRMADAGADALLGTVEPFADDLSARQARAWTVTHPNGRAVGHVHGANLGVRASAYLRIGGFAARQEHEDVDLVDRLRSISATVISSDTFPVATSGRTTGRTPGGYAGYMRLLDRMVEPTG
jgi:glycosyltransferase involved in cell wall biosynthesis